VGRTGLEEEAAAGRGSGQGGDELEDDVELERFSLDAAPPDLPR